MLFIGDKGKILCDFRANKPRLIPQSRQQAFEGSVGAAGLDRHDAGRRVGQRHPERQRSRAAASSRSPPLAEAVTLAGHRAAGALQAAAVGRREDGVHQLPGGEAFVRREQYRPGWEAIVG